MKHQQAGAQALAQRIETLERTVSELNRRLEALEKVPKLDMDRRDTYQPAFDRWPGNVR